MVYERLYYKFYEHNDFPYSMDRSSVHFYVH